VIWEPRLLLKKECRGVKEPAQAFVHCAEKSRRSARRLIDELKMDLGRIQQRIDNPFF
jgi:hypothetical protein